MRTMQGFLRELDDADKAGVTIFVDSGHKFSLRLIKQP